MNWQDNDALELFSFAFAEPVPPTVPSGARNVMFGTANNIEYCTSLRL